MLITHTHTHIIQGSFKSIRLYEEGNHPQSYLNTLSYYSFLFQVKVLSVFLIIIFTKMLSFHKQAPTLIIRLKKNM